jgi:hypothetical protein
VSKTRRQRQKENKKLGRLPLYRDSTYTNKPDHKIIDPTPFSALSGFTYYGSGTPRSKGVKPMPRRELVSFRLPAGIHKENVESKMLAIAGEEAKRRVKVDVEGASDIYEAAVGMFLGMSPYFILLMSGLAERWQLPPALVIENLALARYAEMKSEAEENGKMELSDFAIHGEEGIIKGEQFFDICLQKLQYKKLSNEAVSKQTSSLGLPPEKAAILEDAQRKANEKYYLAKTQPPDLAEKTIAEGKTILQKAADKIKKK